MGYKEDTESLKAIKKALPGGVILAGPAKYEGLILYSVSFPEDELEGTLDTVWAVDSNKKVKNFPVTQDPVGITSAFEQANDISHTATNAFLSHYGVKGMKWGVRKDRSSTSSQRKGPSKASVQTQGLVDSLAPLMNVFIPRGNPRTFVLNTVNAILQSGGALSVSSAAFKTATNANMLIGLGISSLDSGVYRVPGVSIKNALKGGWNKKPELAKKNMSANDISKKVVKQINPDYPGLGTTNNCLRASYAFEMRRRGYDVAATKTVLGSGQNKHTQKLVSGFKDSSKKIKGKPQSTTRFGRLFKGDVQSAQTVYKAMANQPERSRGEFQVTWKGTLSGHSIAYEIINKKPVFFDAQSGKVYDSPGSLDYLMRAVSDARYTRLDNKDLNALALPAWIKDAS